MPIRAPMRLFPLQVLLLTAAAATAAPVLAERPGADPVVRERRAAPRAEPVTQADSRRAEPRAARSDDRRSEHGSDQQVLSAAVRRVESRTGGQVLSAERIPFDGRDVSRIKVVDASGRVRIYMDDSQAGPDDPRVRTRNDDN